MMEGPGADSEEKHEPVSDIDTVVVVVVGLKALDPEWPIRERSDGGGKPTCLGRRQSIETDPPKATSAAASKCASLSRYDYSS
jgi:hypothetical protein